MDTLRRGKCGCAAIMVIAAAWGATYEPLIAVPPHPAFVMHRLLSLALLLIPSLAEAKRAAPARVTPVTSGHISYSAPNEDGRNARIVATDARSGKVLWEVTVFQTKINPKLEEDVQWVFIKSLNLTGNVLRIEDEKMRVWELNLTTKVASRRELSRKP